MTWASPRSMPNSEIEHNTIIRVQVNQMRQELTTAFLLVLQAMYLMSKAMAKYMLAIKASIDARLRTMKRRLKKLAMIASVFPLNQVVSHIVEIKWTGMLMTALSMSTAERLAMRTFGSVRRDLNRAMTARTEPLPNTAQRPWTTASTLMTSLLENGFDGYILKVFLFPWGAGVSSVVLV